MLRQLARALLTVKSVGDSWCTESKSVAELLVAVAKGTDQRSLTAKVMNK